MLVAIFAVIITLVVLAAAALIAYSVWNKRQKGHIQAGKHSVSPIAAGDHFRASSRPSASKKKPEDLRVSSSGKGGKNTSSQLQSRFVAMGAFAAAIFGALGVRLWGMQVLSSEEYLEKAQENIYTTVSTTAPRGLIFDAEGTSLVKNRTSLTVLANAEVLQDRTVIQRLSALLGVPHNVVRQRIQDASSGAQSQRVVASDVKLRDVAFIAEHKEAFPGVKTQERTVREYPWGALAAHVLGYTGPISEAEMQVKIDGVNLEMGDTVGKEGIEASYDKMLAGDRGQQVVIADANGVVTQLISETEPTKGNDIHLTINARVQQVADKALAALVAPEGVIGGGRGTAASLVCMDARDGSVLAISNYPTYTPGSFIGGISQEVWDLFNKPESYYPLFNRAISGAYPAASTFKAFTGLAGFEHGFADVGRSWNCTGTWTGFGEGTPQECWNKYGHGDLGFHTGVVQSCDVVFYEIAKSFYEARGQLGDTAMQEFIKRFGFGSLTQVDLGGEIAGRVPTPEWKAEYFADVPEEAPWKPGDLSNMAIGQGYILVTPLQLAVGYAGVATGVLPKPHILKEVKNSAGETVVEAKTEILGDPQINQEHLETMRDALRGVATENSAVRKAFDAVGLDSAAAKTGTAEVEGKEDYGWFACYAPYDDPKYVVACVVEEGGSGAESACPVSIEVLNAVMKYDEGALDVVLEPIPGSTGESDIPEGGYVGPRGRRTD